MRLSWLRFESMPKPTRYRPSTSIQAVPRPIESFGVIDQQAGVRPDALANVRIGHRVAENQPVNAVLAQNQDPVGRVLVVPVPTHVLFQIRETGVPRAPARALRPCERDWPPREWARR